MAWIFSGVVLDGAAGDRIVAGTGEPEELPGRYALAGLVDAHSHPTVAVDERGPYLADGDYGAARLDEYAASGVTVIRDTGGRSQVTLSFARTAVAGRPIVTAAGRFLSSANRYFPRMYSPAAPDELVASIQAEVAAGAAPMSSGRSRTRSRSWPIMALLLSRRSPPPAQPRVTSLASTRQVTS